MTQTALPKDGISGQVVAGRERAGVGAGQGSSESKDLEVQLPVQETKMKERGKKSESINNVVIKGLIFLCERRSQGGGFGHQGRSTRATAWLLFSARRSISGSIPRDTCGPGYMLGL